MTKDLETDGSVAWIIRHDAWSITTRMSETLPTVLHSIVADDALFAFSDQIDVLLEAIDVIHRRHRLRLWGVINSCTFWLVCLYVLLIWATAFSLVAVILWPFQIAAVWLYTSLPKNHRTEKEAMCDIRIECDAMSKCTPYATFHLILTCEETKNTIDHIAISLSTFTSATDPNAVMNVATMADTSTTGIDATATRTQQTPVNTRYQPAPDGYYIELV
jgi:hypothetical protein